jgi:Sec-independent protein translocase protein TatA
VGLGTGILLVLMLGLLVLGPKQLHTLLGRLARAKAQFDEASRTFKSQLGAGFDATDHEVKTETSHELVGDQ